MNELYIANGKNARMAVREWRNLYGNGKVPSEACIRKNYKTKFAKGLGPENRHIYGRRVRQISVFTLFEFSKNTYNTLWSWYNFLHKSFYSYQAKPVINAQLMADAMELIRYGNIGGGVSSFGVQI